MRLFMLPHIVWSFVAYQRVRSYCCKSQNGRPISSLNGRSVGISDVMAVITIGVLDEEGAAPLDGHRRAPPTGTMGSSQWALGGRGGQLHAARGVAGWPERPAGPRNGTPGERWSRFGRRLGKLCFTAVCGYGGVQRRGSMSNRCSIIA